MGMYTSIIHPDDERELQIKTGDDECHTYRVGDEVKWRINQRIGGWGTLLDGVYRSYHVPDFEDENEVDWETFDGHDDWVVIKDHKVVAVEDAQGQYWEDAWDARAMLEKKYNIQEPDPTLWPEKSWKFLNDTQDKVDREYEEIKNLPKDEQSSATIEWLGSSRLNYQEIGRNLLKIDELPQGALTPYERKEAAIAKIVARDKENDSKDGLAAGE